MVQNIHKRQATSLSGVQRIDAFLKQLKLITKMPVKLRRLRSTNLVFIAHTCDECGADANFGIGVSFRKALNQMVAGKTNEGQRLLGKWYCLKHWKELNEKHKKEIDNAEE